MNRRAWQVLTFVTLGLAFALSQASGHTVFKKQMQKKYENLIVKCEACHLKGKPKTERNDFGNLFYNELKDDGLTAQWEKLKGAEKKKFENEVMVPKFEEVLELVKTKTNGEGQAYDSLLTEGKLENTKIKSGDDEEDEEDEDDDGDGDGGGQR